MDNLCLFIVDLLFHLTVIYLTSIVERRLVAIMYYGKKASGYNVMQQVLVMIKFTHVVDYLARKMECLSPWLCGLHMTLQTAVA